MHCKCFLFCWDELVERLQVVLCPFWYWCNVWRRLLLAVQPAEWKLDEVQQNMIWYFLWLYFLLLFGTVYTYAAVNITALPSHSSLLFTHGPRLVNHAWATGKTQVKLARCEIGHACEIGYETGQWCLLSHDRNRPWLIPHAANCLSSFLCETVLP